MSRSVVPPIAVEYPSGDGKPMAENDAQLLAMHYAIGALRVYYQDRDDVYVSGDLLMYYEEGNPRVSVAPDVFVVFGVEDRMRMRYLVWEEGKGPDFVLEVASKSTWREDLGPKRDIYARLGVKEYWMYDPTGEYFTPPVLQGLRLAGSSYVRQLAGASPDGALTLASETLGLELRVQGAEMRFRDPATGRTLLSQSEAEAARRKAESRADAAVASAEREAAARREAESRADAAAASAEREAAARREEAGARRAAEARVAELEALLGNRGT